jgi:hypothetical protein
MKNLITYEQYMLAESTINEGAVKQFEVAIKNLISNIRSGYGWIDPEYVYDTVVTDSEFDEFEWKTIKDEVYKRLIDQNLLYYANDADPETKGQKVSKVEQIKESINKASDEFVPATLTEDFEDLAKGSTVKIKAIDYTSGGDKETVESIRPDGNKMDIKKSVLTVKI